MELSDTSPKALEIYYRRLAVMTPAEKLNIAADSGQPAIPSSVLIIRRDHPDADDNEINFRLAVLRYGEDLARKAYRRQ